MSLSPTARELKAAQTCANLSEAAITLFREHGVERVTIDDICARCGVTKGAFYHHFPSKDHIITYAVNHEMDSYIKERFRPQPNRPVCEQLLALQTLSFSYFRRLGKAMTRYSYEGQIRSQIELKRPERPYVYHLSQIVSEGVEKKQFRSRLDFENCYMMNIILYTGFLFKWASVPQEQDGLYQWDAILKELIASLFVKN